MLKNFKGKRVEIEKEIETNNNTNLKTAEQRMKIDIQKYDENKIDNVTLSFPKEGCITELHIKIVPNKDRSFYRNSLITFSFKATE